MLYYSIRFNYYSNSFNCQAILGTENSVVSRHAWFVSINLQARTVWFCLKCATWKASRFALHSNVMQNNSNSRALLRLYVKCRTWWFSRPRTSPANAISAHFKGGPQDFVEHVPRGQLWDCPDLKMGAVKIFKLAGLRNVLWGESGIAGVSPVPRGFTTQYRIWEILKKHRDNQQLQNSR